MWTTRYGTQSTVQSMSIILGRRHRLLHVRALQRRRTRNSSSSLLTSFRFPTTTSRKVDPTVTATGRKKGITSTSSRISSRRIARREFLSIHDRFIRDARFRKTTIELGRTEEVIREMDKLANEDHTHTTLLKKKLVYTATIGGSVRNLLVPTRCP